ncbi:MAG: hypothetical protein COB89_05150 [Piscirickettsiaceae bacterium]|nr:MAG: hypothetical protein COB89_05150 [Piscirickettsiaceae bacterium]
MSIKKVSALTTMLFVGSVGMAQAGWQDFLNSAVKTVTDNKSTTEMASSMLGESEIVAGLKEALANGVETAVKTLGKTDGFMGNSLVQIPLPDSLKLVEKTARSLGQGQYADDFISTMNHAAEEAVPEAAELLGEAIRNMSVEDATKILNGPDDAATQYFRKVSGEQLANRFKPIVEKATNQAGVTSAYKGLTANAGSLLGGFISQESLDVDKYVTDKALDGLFTYIAIEEKKIRENPLARSTDLLKKVFGN